MARQHAEQPGWRLRRLCGLLDVGQSDRPVTSYSRRSHLRRHSFEQLLLRIRLAGGQCRPAVSSICGWGLARIPLGPGQCFSGRIPSGEGATPPVRRKRLLGMTGRTSAPESLPTPCRGWHKRQTKESCCLPNIVLIKNLSNSILTQNIIPS